MKKILSLSTLRLPLSLIVFYLLIAQTSFAQDCKTQAANKPSTLVRGTDDIISPSGKMSSIDLAKMKAHLGKAENWIKNRIANFTGAKLLYSNNFYPDYQNGGPISVNFYKATGIKSSYSSQMRFFAYYCYDNSNTIHTEAESGSSVSVVFNNVFASGLTTDAGVYAINVKPAFKTIQKKHSEGRIDFYEQRSQDNATAKMYTSNDYIILRNSDKPVFLPVIRKEYLQQMLKDIETSGTSDSKFMTEVYTQNVKQFEAEMKAYKNDKTYTPEKEAKRRKWFEEDQEKLKIVINKTSPDADASKAIILKYLNKPAEWLSRSFNNFYPYSTYTANGLSQYLENLDKSFVSKGEEETYNEIVSINPAYFNKAFSSDVPQLIMLYLRNGSYPHMLKVAALVKQPGALAPLEAMLNPGKSASPVVTPTEIVSNYSLSYLPKLTKLPALTVPADMKPSLAPIANNYNNAAPAATFSFTIPPRSPKLNQLPQPLTTESYKTYIQQLYTSILNAVKPNEKKKADDYLKTKNLTQSKDISNTAFATWLQNVPTVSLYLYSKALVSNPSDALAANNFSAFLIMGGLPEKSIPMLEYWNIQKPGEATLLSNLGNAYYQLGDVDNAMKYLQECVKFDTLNPTANKILCMMYMKKGNTKKAEEHATKSLTTSYDEQVVAILHEIGNNAKPGEIMSQLPVEEFPMLKRIKLLEMPSNLDEMEQFATELEAEKKSMEMTIADIDSKTPKINNDLSQKLLMASLKKGISPLRVKAQYIIMDGMQTYQRESIRESDVFKYQLKKLAEPFNTKTKAIHKNYAEKLNKLEGGEAGDEDEIATLELAKCKELNAATGKYLAELSPLVNTHAQRMEYISRKFYGEYAYWGPYWMPETTISFPSIESAYLKDISSILSEYRIVNKSDCSVSEELAKKDGKLQEWEDEFCASFKGNYGIGGASLDYNCNGWKIEGGEGLLGEMGVNYNDDGSFDSFTLGGGLGANWNVGSGGVAEIEAGASVKEFVKIGKDRSTGTWEVKDFGAKGKVSLEGKVLGVSAGDINVAEVSVTVNAGVQVGGAVAPVLNLK